MANLTSIFVKIETANHEKFIGKYVSPATGDRDKSYDGKICFLEKSQEIFTQGKLFGLNNSAEVTALGTLIGTLPKRPAVGTEGEAGYEAERDYASVVEYINEMATGQAEVSSKLSTAITVAGGPLANNIAETGEEWPWPLVDGNKVIPAGTSFEEIFTKLFLKTIDGTISITYSTWSPSIDAPTASVKQGTTSLASATVEVGTQATAAYSVGTTVSNNSISALLTANQGYFEGTNTTWNAAASEKSIETVNGTTSGTAAISSAQWNGVDVATNATVTVGEGANKLIVSESGVTASCTGDFTNTTYYASDNTKKKLTASATVADQTLTDKPLTSSKTITVTGVRYMYYGGTNAATIDSAAIRALHNNGTNGSSKANANSNFSIFAVAGDTKLVFAAPTGTRGISSVLNVKASNAECVSSFVKQASTVRVAGANGFADANYDVWVYTADAAFSGGEEFKFTLSK